MKAFKAGVYLLYDKGEVVYVGQSKNPMYRIGSHIQEGKKQFDEFLVYETENYDAVEAFLIRALRPKYNLEHPYTQAKRIKSEQLLNLIVDAQKKGIKKSDEWLAAKRQKKKDENLALKREVSELKHEKALLETQKRSLEFDVENLVDRMKGSLNVDKRLLTTKTAIEIANTYSLQYAMHKCDLGTVSELYHQYAREIYAS